MALDDTWWVNWALLATAMGLGATGQPIAARSTFEELLRAELRPLERARVRLRYAELLLEAGDDGAARVHFDEAAAAFDASGARYWAMRSLVGSLATRHPAATAVRRRARKLQGADIAYQRAWHGNSRLEVQVLGAERATVNGLELRFLTQRAEAAFYLLALAGEAGVLRETLAVSLWPDASAKSAGANLRTHLWHIRRALGIAGERLKSDKHRVWLAADAVDLKVALGHVAEGRPIPSELTRALLPKFRFEEWVIDYQRELDAVVR